MTSVGEILRPAIRSLQPEAITAGREMTNYLKPAMERLEAVNPEKNQVYSDHLGLVTYP